MPQLSPWPWFSIMMMSWTIFMYVIPNKVETHTSPNSLNSYTKTDLSSRPWPWPWS